MTDWYRLEINDTLAELSSTIDDGLDDGEAAARLARFGPNELVEKGRANPVRLLWEQLSSIMVVILIVAAVVSALLGKITEAMAIGAIVFLFAILGFVQEYRAEQAMAALKQMAVPVVRIRRRKRVSEIPAQQLVPGDIVLLEAGNVVPADARLVESVNLRVQESALTGESEPVDKLTEAIDRPEVPLGDRRNMVYMGTVVTYGRGTAVVVETGMNTELGRIASLIQGVESEETPLQRQLDGVGKGLAILGLVVAVLVAIIGLIRGETPEEMLLTAVSVAVAVVPEGLPAVVTVTLALGAQRMLRRRALIRKLPAVETLGSVTIICSDKTGTLTENRMTVTIIDVAGHFIELAGTSVDPAPVLTAGRDHWVELVASQPLAVSLSLIGGSLCNDASLQPDPDSGRFLPLGDPTEGALLVAAAQAGLDKEALQQVMPRLAEIPFDSERKRMTTVHPLPEARHQVLERLQAVYHVGGPYLAITKGSVDGLLELASEVWVDDGRVTLDDEWRARIQLANDQMAQKGMRVLGVAMRWLADIPRPANEQLEQDLTLVGLIGMIDPPRPEVRSAVQTCLEAGIRPIMITGDHPLTAQFIAHELGISQNGRVKTGQDLNRMSPEEMAEVVDKVSIYARVAPEHKLRIVETLQQKGQVVAMTGDGVNDSPALKKADIGIAMGITGTDVSKEASEMVLMDDNFATIVSAVEEGRVIYDNIVRFIKFSIAGNFGKILVMLLSPLLGINIALLPLQLLWLNLLTDGLLGLGLGVEPAEPGTMKRPPRSPQAGILVGMRRHMAWVGATIGLLALAVGALFYDPAAPEDTTWQTMIFTSLAFLQIGQAFASRSSRESLFSQGLKSNLSLLWMALIVFALQLVVIYVPFLDQFFKVTPLSMAELAICLFLGVILFAAIELEKWLKRRK